MFRNFLYFLAIAGMVIAQIEHGLGHTLEAIYYIGWTIINLAFYIVFTLDKDFE